MVKTMEDQDKSGQLNPIYIMADSGRADQSSKSANSPACAA